MTEAMATASADRSSRRRPWLAFLLTWLTPGLGHLYAGSVSRAFVAFLTWLTIATITICLLLPAFASTLSIVVGALAIIVITLGIPLDAAITARSGRPLGVNRWARLAIYAAILVGFGAASNHVNEWIKSRIIESIRIPADGMVPTLYPGDRLLIDKRAYAHTAPSRGDVVVLSATRDGGRIVPADSRPDLPRERFLKRIVASPGDRIRVAGGTVFLNGTPLTQTPAGSASEGGHELELFRETLDRSSYAIARDRSAPRPDTEEVVVPPDRYFVIGDNRDWSSDSRFWGTISRADIVGRAYQVWFSFHPVYRHLAWDRFGLRIDLK